MPDRQGNIPAFMAVKPAKIHEIHILDSRVICGSTGTPACAKTTAYAFLVDNTGKSAGATRASRTRRFRPPFAFAGRIFEMRWG